MAKVRRITAAQVLVVWFADQLSVPSMPGTLICLHLRLRLAAAATTSAVIVIAAALASAVPAARPIMRV